MKAIRIIFVLSVVCTSLVYSSCVENVTELPNMPLRQPSRLLEDGPHISDDNLNYEWYGVVHNGWQYIMVDSTQRPNYTSCFTYYPVYLKDTHPSIDKLTETPTNAVACKRDYLDPCDIQHQVKIRKCGDEIQYYLPPTKSYSAFCFSNYSQLHITPDISDVVLGNIDIAPELRFNENASKIKPGKTRFDPYFQFRCLFNVQEAFYYKVSWYVDGALLVSYGPTTDINGLLFHQSVLIGNNITMGFDIYCGVSALTSEDADAGVTEMVFSKNYFAGIKVSSTTININKGDTAVLQMTSTMPIGCGYDDAVDNECIENFQIFNEDNEGFQCQAGVANLAPQPNQRCSNGLKTLKNGTIWNPDTVFNFSIVTTDMNYNDKRLFYLLLQFPDTMGHKIWRNYNFPLVKVIVSDNGEYKNKICYSHIDPHMRSADGVYYEQQRKDGQLFPGVFLLYHNTKYGIEVQQQTKTCNNELATCACGIAIRAGKDVFMINRCGSINYLGFTKCEDGGILQVVKRHDYKYDIFTPIGTKITVQLFQNEYDGSYQGTMNIDITMAPKDLYNIEGLCGQFDNNPANDFRHRDGAISEINIANQNSHFADFTESWSLTSGETEHLNLFSTGHRLLNSWGDVNGMFCVCASDEKVAEATCYPTQYLNCTMNKSITGTKCNVQNRRKRNADDNFRHDKELDRLLQLMTPLNTPNKETRVKRQENNNNNNNFITKEGAEKLCKEKISGSLAVQKYSEVGGNEDPEEVVKQCTFDVLVGNDTSWATAHVESINNIVKNIIEKEPSYVENNTEKVVTFYKNTCPGNCSNNGKCTDKSECVCYGFFHGPECDIDERDPLIIDDIEGGGECDLAEGDECLCFHVRSSNILEGFKCQANIYKITVSGEKEIILTQSFSGEYEDIFTGVCCIQDNVTDTEGLFVTKYDFSISNNGITYGNEKSVHIFDSSCQEAKYTSFENASFSLKPEFCFINGHCVADNAMSPVGCLACQSAVDAFNWTDIDECQSGPCENEGTCTDHPNSYTCSCVDGFTGNNCEININECLSHPCRNNGICKDGVNTFTCECQPGFKGIHCETESDNCAANPCENGGTCEKYSNSRVCRCVDGYTGANCEIDINDCENNPCENGASCTDLVNSYQCTCVSGYEGANCGIDINECSTDPCKHGGSCVDLVNGYNCTCVAGYDGTDCENEINECLSYPCKNGGTCQDLVNKYECLCVAGYEGTNCGNVKKDINRCSSDPCKNGSTCKDLVNGYECTCVAGYDGTNCDNDINNCSSDPCKNGGICKDLVNEYECTCVAGYDGKNCENNINDCSSDPCKNGGTCTDLVNDYKCTCVAGYDGTHCEKDINDCSPNPCKNGGTCKDLVNGYECTCAARYVGTNCDNEHQYTDINKCSSIPCKNGGTCKNLINGYECTCVAGYDGINCDNDINECSSDPCKNGGTCKDLVNKYECTCAVGYEGTNCDNDINECLSDPCKNSGTCKELVNGYECTCAAGYKGTHCDNVINECSSDPCKNGGTCKDVINGYTCICVAGYDGTNCDNDINKCSSSPCKNGGTCEDLVNGYKCRCVDGYDGNDCDNVINECSSDPCKNGGTCKDLVNKYECTCAAGYEGTKCDKDINECLSDPCKNGGTCNDLVNGYECTCVAGYKGTNCDNVINECSSDPCKNGGKCKDLINGYECICVAGYDGTNCDNDIDDCSKHPCENGGTCKDELNGYKCLCADEYEGDNCKTFSPTTTMSPEANLARTTISMIFPFQSKMNITDPKLKFEVTTQLTKVYEDNMGKSLKALDLLRLSVESLMVEFEIVYENKTSAANDLTETTIAFLNGQNTIAVSDETVSATSVEINSITVTYETSSDEAILCKLYETLLGHCQENQKCSVMKGNPSCVFNEEKIRFGLILVIIVVVCSIFVPIIIMTIICLAIRKKCNKDKRYKRSESVSNDSEEFGKSPYWKNPKLMSSF